MAPMFNNNNQHSSNYGEDVVQRVNVLASCYVVDSAANLKGLHYCTTGVAGKNPPHSPLMTCALTNLLQGPSGIPEVPSSGLPSPPTSPPLAALTSSNELALMPKQHKRREIPGRRLGRRGGAALSIREECERFFCETMKTAFHGEEDPSMNGSGLSGAYLPTPPPDDYFTAMGGPVHAPGKPAGGPFGVGAWMEVWDYAGGASFRAFVADGGDDDKTLFVFFDHDGVLGRDLKKALMALIELADGPLQCSRVVTCIDRRIPADGAIELTKSLQWVGFELSTLDHWAQSLDATSNRWVLMSMEV